MKVTIDKKFSKWLRDKVIDSVMEDRRAPDGKWHVSDLIFPRFAYFVRKHGDEPDEDAVGFFVTGEAYHQFFQKILGEKNAEVRGDFEGILGTADYVKGFVIEFKTSRKWTVPDHPEEHYIEQAEDYCVMWDKKLAYIVVIYPTAGRKYDGSHSSTVEIVAWKLELTDADLDRIADRMRNQKKQLDKAVKSNKHSHLPLCPTWKCGSFGWKDKSGKTPDRLCPFYHLCKPDGRYPEHVLSAQCKQSKFKSRKK